MRCGWAVSRSHCQRVKLLPAAVAAPIRQALRKHGVPGSIGQNAPGVETKLVSPKITDAAIHTITPTRGDGDVFLWLNGPIGISGRFRAAVRPSKIRRQHEETSHDHALCRSLRR